MATLRDVARVAGVSCQTVSRALNAPDTVLPATRDRIESAIQTLGYYPNAAARRLKLGRSRLLGMVTTDLLGFGPTRTVQAFMEAAESESWTVLLVRFDPARRWDEVTAGSTSSLNVLFEYDVQLVGLVGGTPEVAAAITRIAPRLPVLNIGAPLAGYASVGVDQQHAVMELVDHLVALGHRHIAHLAGPESSPDAAAREHGWRTAIRAHALAEPPVIRGDWTATSAFAALSRLRAPRFTALVCANDQMAFGALRALRASGLLLPRDVSIVGFDDIDEAANYEPPLTTVHQPFEVVGQRALQATNRLLADPHRADVELIDAELRLRDSTARPAW